MFSVLYEKFCEWLEAAQEPIFIERKIADDGAGVLEAPEDATASLRAVNVLRWGGCECEGEHSGLCDSRIYVGERAQFQCDPDGVQSVADATTRASDAVRAHRCGFETKRAAQYRSCNELGLMAHAHLCEKEELLSTLVHLTPAMCKQYPETMAHINQLLRLNPRSTYTAAEMPLLRKSAAYLQMIVQCTNANCVPGDTSRPMVPTEARYKSAVLIQDTNVHITVANALLTALQNVNRGIHELSEQIGEMNESLLRSKFRDFR